MNNSEEMICTTLCVEASDVTINHAVAAQFTVCPQPICSLRSAPCPYALSRTLYAV